MPAHGVFQCLAQFGLRPVLRLEIDLSIQTAHQLETDERQRRLREGREFCFDLVRCELAAAEAAPECVQVAENGAVWVAFLLSLFLFDNRPFGFGIDDRNVEP